MHSDGAKKKKAIDLCNFYNPPMLVYNTHFAQKKKKVKKTQREMKPMGRRMNQERNERTGRLKPESMNAGNKLIGPHSTRVEWGQ
jgi:hypothetical protein